MTDSPFSPEEHEELVEIAKEAFIWGSPLVQWGLYRRIRDYWYFPTNRTFGRLGVIDDDFAPSQELMYTLLDFDLTREPQIFRLPRIEDRYYSFQLCDRFFNPFCYLSSRTLGAGGGDFAICPPGFDGDLPEGVTRIDCPVDRVLTYGRTEIRGKDDEAAAVAVARQYEIAPLSTYPEGFAGHFAGHVPIGDYELYPPYRGDTDGIRFFDKLCIELLDQPFATDEQEMAERFERIDVGPGRWPTENRAIRPILKEGMRLGQEAIDDCDAVVERNGWRSALWVGPTFDDMVLRAHLQAPGGGVNVAAEAMYFRCYDGPDGTPLNGTKTYRLVFPGDELPPVDAFWSICLQGLDGIPVKNPIDRHAISSVMNDLTYGDDGSLEIVVGSDEPGPGDRGNWLPSAAGEDFYLFMRAYRPTEELVSGAYTPPAVELVGS